MQRKETKTTRGPKKCEKDFQAWLKNQPCCVTGREGPSIVHHCEGATFKHNKVLIGHWFCIPLCQEVDDVITHGSRRKFRDMYGAQSTYALNKIFEYEDHNDCVGSCPAEVIAAIAEWNK